MPHILIAGKLHPSGLALLDRTPDVTYDHVEDISEESYQPYLDRADGMPEGWHLGEDETDALRQARADAQQAQQQAAMAMELATKQPDLAVAAAGAATGGQGA